MVYTGYSLQNPRGRLGSYGLKTKVAQVSALSVSVHMHVRVRMYTCTMLHMHAMTYFTDIGAIHDRCMHVRVPCCMHAMKYDACMLPEYSNAIFRVYISALPS